MKNTQGPAENLILLFLDELNVGAVNFSKITGFCGLEKITTFDISTIGPPDYSTHLAMDSRTAQRLMDYNSWLDYCKYKALSLFIFSTSKLSWEGAALETLCGKPLAGVSEIHPESVTFSIPQNATPSTLELAGMEFKSDFSFPLYASNSQDFESSKTNLGQLNGKTFFRVYNSLKAPVYVTWVPPSVDIDEPADRSADLKIYAPYLLPAMMYIKTELSGYCWKHPAPMANLIVDDPFLKGRYGFLVLPKLFSFLKKNRLAATIAFIPWNWKRTQKKIAKSAAEHGAYFEICVHGNDHTRGEFETTDPKQLSDILSESLERMRGHTLLSGLSYVKALVFPQGKFSAISMQFLKYFNFSAAINSGPFPVVPGSFSLPIRELLNPAVLLIGGFPLFTRKYPSQGAANFQLFAFLGKPLFAVEHHQFFADNFVEFQNLANKFSSFPFKVKWKPISEILSQGYKWKVEPNGHCTIQIFSHFCRIRPMVNNGKIIHFEKYESEPEKVSSVLLNNNKHSHSHSNNRLIFKYQIESQEEFIINIQYHRPKSIKPGKNKAHGRLYVWARRRMCDIRDNYLQPLKTNLNS